MPARRQVAPSTSPVRADDGTRTTLGMAGGAPSVCPSSLPYRLPTRPENRGRLSAPSAHVQHCIEQRFLVGKVLIVVEPSGANLVLDHEFHLVPPQRCGRSELGLAAPARYSVGEGPAPMRVRPQGGREHESSLMSPERPSRHHA